MTSQKDPIDVVLFGATGNIGRAIAHELVARDHRVTGVTRSGSAHPEVPGVTLLRGDATDADRVAEVVQGRAAVISAIGPRLGSNDPAPFLAAAQALVAGLRATGLRRLLVVGGAGGLEIAPGVQAVDSPDFPVAYRPNALAQRDAFEYYRTVDDLDWTYVAPAAEIGPGDHHRDYQLGHHLMLFDERGVSHISYADYADGMVDCLEQGTHLRERITLAD